jgi:hypothetical protein
MRTLFVSVLALLACFRAAGQVSMDLALDQNEFLPNEAIRVTVKITNTSGQVLHLGSDEAWLTFSMETADGTVVVKNGEVPVVEPFDLESSQMAIKHVDLQPYFQLARPDRYKVIATMRIKAWGLTVNSPPAQFDLIHGGEIWSQNFGVPGASNAPPESRRYTLIKANYLREQLRLYLQVSSGDGFSTFKATALGPMVSFSLPEEEVDPLSRLHVLWQTGGQSFCYVTVSPDGLVLSRDVYDNFNSRPHLVLNDSGEVRVRGGTRRPKPGEIPLVREPVISATSPTSSTTATSSVPATSWIPTASGKK